MVQKSVFSRQIDLMKPDQYLALTGFQDDALEYQEILIIGNEFIAVKVNNDFVTMTLLFSQKTHQFVQSLPYRHFVQLSLCVNGIQFFGASKVDDGLEHILRFEGASFTVLPIEEVYDSLKNASIYSEDYSQLLPDYLLQLTVEEDEQEQLVSFFEIRKLGDNDLEKDNLTDDCIYLRRLCETKKLGDLINVQCDKYKGQPQFDCFQLSINAGEIEARDVKIFFTQDFLVISTLTDIYWTHKD